MPATDASLQAQLTELLAPLWRALRFPLESGSPLYWPYLLGTLAFALLAWWRLRGAGSDARRSLGAFAREHLSARSWWHPSARADYRFYLVNALLYPLVFAPLLWWSASVATLVDAGLTSVFGNGVALPQTWATQLAYTLVFFVVFDFGRWLAHSALHDIPVLWAFHQVHHSAQVLTPVTAFRVHPVDLLVTNGLPMLLTGVVTGLAHYLVAGSIGVHLFLGAHVLIAVTGLVANLRHSRVWLDGGVLNRWWISPAHHQLHHSAEPRHWGKNRGFELALWDRLHGTLLLPSREPEPFALGLGSTDDAAWHSVRRLYLWPFRDAWNALRQRAGRAAS